MLRLPEFRFTLGQAMIAVGVIGVYMGFFASFKHHPELILLILGMGTGYWVILVLPFAILEEVARRRADRSNRRQPEGRDPAGCGPPDASAARPGGAPGRPVRAGQGNLNASPD